MNLSLKAQLALLDIATDNRQAVSRQMIDRLCRDGLIDFDWALSPKHGWYITAKGCAAMGHA
jgi:hypothetical protein